MESLLHLDAALARLTHLRMVARIPRALDHLVELQQQTQLLTLYQHYFPREWAQSRTELQPKPDYLYSPRELEFTELVYTRMFPLNYWGLYDLVQSIPMQCARHCARLGAAWGFEERLPYVPLEYTALQFWSVQPEHLSLSVRVLASLLYGEEWGSWEMLLARAGISTMLDTGSAIFSTDISFDWQRLRNLSRRAGKPLAWLPDALSVVSHATGSPWLDFDEENGHIDEFFWTVEDFDWLTSNWKLARPLIYKWNTLHDWLEADPRRLAQVIDLWSRSIRLDQKGQ